jgi:hypothetical protein
MPPRNFWPGGLSLVLMGVCAAADAQPLRLDMVPPEMRGPDGRYQPLRAQLTIPEVPRNEVICFCLYTLHKGTLKLSAQLYPLAPGESRSVKLHIELDGRWVERGQAEIDPVAWNALFRVDQWDGSRRYRYRVTHAGGAVYEGTIRQDPVGKDEIVVANLSCNSSTDRNLKPDMIANLKAIDPDLLFFAGDQSYDHKEHTAAWLLFGRQFGEIIKDRPTVTIPDDHDVGHPNVWGAGGKVSTHPAGADGGYMMPVEYVNMVQRQQTSHLPDPYDPTPILRGITVYYTALNVGGIDFAVLEDRKWKSGPLGLIPQMGPRPDHITEPGYDPKALDLPEAELLGPRQLKFLSDWGQQWEGVVMKCVLSQSPFAGAAHLHGPRRDRLWVDLDCNGWPQSGRDAALREIRRSFAFMMSGDQHLATVIHHGVNDWGDAGWQFTSPAIWNLYGRVWEPNSPPVRRQSAGPLPLTGDFHDGLANKITMVAYANPAHENYQGTGFGIARFRKSTRQIAMECWPRFVDVAKPGATQYSGWPVVINQEDNYARKPIAWLPRLEIQGASDPVIQVVDEADGQVVYTIRIPGQAWSARVFRAGSYTVRIGDGKRWTERRGVASNPVKDATTLRVEFPQGR